MPTRDLLKTELPPPTGLPRPMVWLLEDSPAQAEITRDVLSRTCAVVHFPDGGELLEALQEALPDVLVLDWELPDISGLEVLKLVRMQHDEVALPALMLTVRNTQEELLEAFQARANDFASKPCNPLELTARVITLARVSMLHKRSREAGRALERSLALEEEARQEAQQQRQQMEVSASELRHVTDALPVLLAHVTQDERYALVNRAYEAWFGLPREQLIGRTLLEVVGEAAYAQLSQYVKRALAGECFSFEQYAVPYRTGGVRDIRVDFVPRRTSIGAPNGYVVLLQDITEARRAADEREQLLLQAQKLADQLRKSEQQMRSVMEASGAGLWSLDAATGDVETNERALTLLGLPSGTHLNIKFGFETIHPEDRRRVADEVEAVLRGRTHRYLVEFRTISPDGSVLRWVESRAQLVMDDERQRSLLAGTMLDITERKQLEAQREQARLLEGELRRSAEHASRAKDEFMAMLGHELRNPLAPILTVLELMRMKRESQLADERALIERHARHMARLVEDLLDVSRIAAGKIELRKERVELGEVVARAVETAAHLLEQNSQKLTVSVPATGLLVEADVARLTQVFSNLLTNAAKYTDIGGAVQVRAHQSEGHVTVEVSDTGRGISADMLPRVFDLFSQESQNLDRSQGGLGLGLAIVKSMTELHGGSASAASPGPGQGSTFSIELPLSTRKTPSRPTLPPIRRLDEATSRDKVLVVDDNEDAAQLLTVALQHRGSEARCAYDAAEAMELVERWVPDVAILDIGLPGVDGFQLAGLLRARLGDTIRLIALTGYGQPEDRARAHAAGFDLHLVKPAALDQLQRAVRTLASGGKIEG